jgi:hypothetical protein
MHSQSRLRPIACDTQMLALTGGLLPIKQQPSEGEQPAK